MRPSGESNSGQQKPDLEKVMDYYQLDMSRVHHGRWCKIRCPVHVPDRNPSAQVNLDEGYWNCFSCGARGSAWDLIMAKEGLDFRGALNWAKDHIGYEGGAIRKGPPQRYRSIFASD